MTSPRRMSQDEDHRADMERDKRRRSYKQSEMFAQPYKADDLYSEIVAGCRWHANQRPRKAPEEWPTLNDSLALLKLEEDYDTVGELLLENSQSSLEHLRSVGTMASSSSLSSSSLSLNASACSLLMASSTSLQAPRRKRVRFSTVEVREHAVTVGDNPSCNGPCPLTLGWAYSTPKVQPVDSTVDDPTHKHRRVRCLSAQQRRQRVAEVQGCDMVAVKFQEVQILLQMVAQLETTGDSFDYEV